MPKSMRFAKQFAAKIIAAVVLTLPILSAPSWAQGDEVIELTISGGQESAQPIAIVPFVGVERNQEDIAAIVSQNLSRTSRFAPIDRARLPARPGFSDQIVSARWQQLGVEALLVGSMERQADGAVVARCRLHDVFSGKVLDEFAFAASEDQLRRLAHRIADHVYQTLTGERGVFQSRLLYVKASGRGDKRRYFLQVADWDGGNPTVVWRSSEPLLSPTWHPDGKRFAYVSYESSRAEIYLQHLNTGRRQRVSSRRGLNNAPAFSPDGRRLAFVLSDGDNADIYLRDLTSGNTRQLTRHAAIDTEPEWAPDGRSVFFTSDRGGSSQIYQANLLSGRVSRLTFEGRSNSRPRVSSDGKKLAVVHAGRNGDQISLLDLENQSGLQALSFGNLDDSPSFSPDGQFVAFAAATGRGNRIMVMNADGGGGQWTLPITGDVREPVWSK